MFSLKGRTALITGAAKGIGRTIAVKLVEAGCDVAVSDKPEVDLGETVEECRTEGSRGGPRIYPVAMDVRDPDQITDGVRAAQEQLGRIDILVNNAGINRPTPALEVDAANWEDHFRTNVRGGFFCAQAVAPGMIENGFGRIIFISSQSGFIGIPGQPAYCASKGAIVNLVRSLGVEWAKHNITVNSIAPTFIETDLTRERLENPEFLKFVLGKIPKGELARTDDVAHAVVYLASDEAGMVNCFNLSVDGGWTAW